MLHVLLWRLKVRCKVQVNPESADEVKMDSMWTRHGVHEGDSILNDKSVSTAEVLDSQ